MAVLCSHAAISLRITRVVHAHRIFSYHGKSILKQTRMKRLFIFWCAPTAAPAPNAPAHIKLGRRIQMQPAAAMDATPIKNNSPADGSHRGCVVVSRVSVCTQAHLPRPCPLDRQPLLDHRARRLPPLAHPNRQHLSTDAAVLYGALLVAQHAAACAVGRGGWWTRGGCRRRCSALWGGCRRSRAPLRMKTTVPRCTAPQRRRRRVGRRPQLFRRRQ